jgi:TM2 domain-containing membrane protein YozV
MRKKFIFRLAILATFFISFSSLTVLPPSKMEDLRKKQEKATLLIRKATADGSGLSGKELTQIAKEVKGSKLSLKERLALKIFKKKLDKMEKEAGVTSKMPAADGKSQVIALLLCILVGGLGIHRFYLGYTWQGIVQLLTAGGCGIWWLIDLIRIITGSLQPKDGSYGTTL